MSELVCPIADAAERQPGSLALVTSHRQLTYRQYHRYCAATVENLQRAGLHEGDLLAIALPNGVQYPIILMALFRLGAIGCLVSTKLPIQSLLRTLASVNCTDIVSPYGVSHTSELGRLYTLSPAALVDEREGSAGRTLLEEEQPATIFFTSGSSGEPKPVLHTYGNHYHNAEASNANIPLAPGDRWLITLPMYHVAGVSILFRCALAGATVVLPRPQEPVHEALERYGATHVSLVATQLYRLLGTPGAVDTLRKLKAILLGGGAIPHRLVEQARDVGLPIHVSYGLTEMASQVTATASNDTGACLHSSGRPLRPDTVRVGDGNEIEVCGPALFAGYVREEGLYRPLTPDGWFRTGDLGHFDGKGCLHVTGRKDNMFVSGGENIQPEEIEQCLCRIEGIEQAVVVPVDDPEFGCVGVAFVKSAGGAFRPRHLRETLAAELPRYKLPKLFLSWPEHVQQSGWKVNRHELKKLAEATPATMRRHP
jgi:O-succinylbenzoic acid--CoA ligase